MNTVSVGNVALNYAEQGEGPGLLLVHGFPLDHTMWRAQIDFFARSHRVLAPDLRGFGGSQVTPGTVTMQAQADDLAALLDALGIHQPIAVCGLSMGGYVAWQFWRNHVSRLSRLILCDTRAAADNDQARTNRLRVAEEITTDGLAELADAMLPNLFAPSTLQYQAELVEQTRSVILNTAPAGIAAAQRGMAERPDVTIWLPEIGVPTLLLAGEHDVITPPDEMEQIARSMPAAQFALIKSAGHMAPLENPTAVNNAIGLFLAER